MQECKVQIDGLSAKPKSLFGVYQKCDDVQIKHCRYQYLMVNHKNHTCVTGIAQLQAFQREKESEKNEPEVLLQNTIKIKMQLFIKSSIVNS